MTSYPHANNREFVAPDFTKFLEYVYDAVCRHGRKGVEGCSRPEHLLLGFRTPEATYLVALNQLEHAANQACGFAFGKTPVDVMLDFYGYKVQATMAAVEADLGILA